MMKRVILYVMRYGVEVWEGCNVKGMVGREVRCGHVRGMGCMTVGGMM